MVVTSEVSCTENFVKFGHAVFEISERTDRQVYRHDDDDGNTWHPYRGLSNEAGGDCCSHRCMRCRQVHHLANEWSFVDCLSLISLIDVTTTWRRLVNRCLRHVSRLAAHKRPCAVDLRCWEAGSSQMNHLAH